MKINKLILILVLSLSGCTNRELKPIEFSSGDICTFCKMVISERQYASEFVDNDGDALKFDDIGCMRNYILKHNSQPAVIFVIDFESNEWLEGKTAFYVRSQEFQTPMGGKTVAFRTEQAAHAAAQKNEGELIRLW